jgi:hypothetical protein
MADVVLCGFCGDPVHRRRDGNFARARGRFACRECYRELTKGILPRVTDSLLSGGRGTPEDDGGPWQQNAVRDMEGG